jgi:lipopolysaccharide export system protein LptA
MKLKDLSFRAAAALIIVMLLLIALPVSVAFADQSGPRDAGDGDDVAGPGTVPWTNPDGIRSPSGEPYAYAIIPAGLTSVTTHYLQGTQYGFAIPAGSTINGIRVFISRRSSIPVGGPAIRDNIVKLVKGGAVTGTNKALTGQDWPYVSFGTATYGDPADLWGTTWTVAEINATNFGVVLSATNPNPFFDLSATVDYMQITVNYTPGTTTTVDCGDGTPVTTYGTPITCEATVTRLAGTNPLVGQVDWTTDGSGSFTPGHCHTSGSGGTATCSVDYTPSAVGDGSHLITATFTPITNFTGSSGSQTVTVNKRPITVTADAKTKVYGEADPPLTYQITSGTLVGGDTFSGALTRAAGENVGAYAIQQGTLALSVNYDLTYVGANLTITQRPITVTADAKTKIYGEADPPLTYQITSGTLVAGDAFTGALTRVPGANVGTYAILQGTLVLSSNYDLTYVGANLTITQRPITVTADAKTKVYGNPDPALTYQVTSGTLVSGDTFSGALTRAAGQNVGAYAIQQGTLALSANYNLTYVGANLTITQRPITVTADAKTKVYGTADPVLTYQITSGSLAYSDAFTGALIRVAGDNVGTYAILQGTLVLTSNYDLTYVGANLTITKATPTLSVTNSPVVYNALPQAADVESPVPGTVSDIRYDGSATVPTNADTYAVTADFTPDDALNYNSLSDALAGNFIIAQRPITVTADAKSKIYGNLDPTLTYQITSGSLAGSDAFTGALTRVPGENVGTYAIQQGTLAISANYNLTYIGANLTITQRPITVTADAKTKVYGTADPPLTYQITSGTLVGSDAFTGALTRVPGEDVGTYAIQQGTLALSANYNLTYIGANLTITKATPTLSVTNSPVIYNGSPQEAVIVGSVPGVVSDIRYDGLATAPTLPGTYEVTADFAPGDTVNYNSLSDASAGEFVIQPAAPALTLVKTPTQTTYYEVGDVINYSYLLTNSGNVTLEGPFTVTDDKVTVTCPATMTLAPLASISCTASYTITPADVIEESVTNIATGSGFFIGDPVVSDSDEATVTLTKFKVYLPRIIK